MVRVVRIQIASSGDPDELERSVLELGRELEDLECISSVEPQSSAAPSSAKSSGSTELGILLAGISATAGAMRYLSLYLRDWLRRNADKHVKIEIDNHVIDLTGLSESTIERLVEQWYGAGD